MNKPERFVLPAAAVAAALATILAIAAALSVGFLTRSVNERAVFEQDVPSK